MRVAALIIPLLAACALALPGLALADPPHGLGASSLTPTATPAPAPDPAATTSPGDAKGSGDAAGGTTGLWDGPSAGGPPSGTTPSSSSSPSATSAPTAPSAPSTPAFNDSSLFTSPSTAGATGLVIVPAAQVAPMPKPSSLGGGNIDLPALGGSAPVSLANAWTTPAAFTAQAAKRTAPTKATSHRKAAAHRVPVRKPVVKKHAKRAIRLAASAR